MMKMLSVYFQKGTKNLEKLVNKYLVEGNYLCRFYRKTGTTVTIFVDTLEEAKEYNSWYLSDSDKSVKHIQIDEKRSTRLGKNDIEEFEFFKVANIQRHIINPILIFLKQPACIFISLKSMLLLNILTILGTGAFIYYDERINFKNIGNIMETQYILQASEAMMFIFMFTIIALIIPTGLFTFKKAIGKYYTKSLYRDKTIGYQLHTLILFSCFYSLILKPSILYITNIVLFMQA